MSTIDLARPADALSRRLKTATAAAHAALDGAIMAGGPFASRERYGRFLRVQHAFHRDLDALYGDPDLARLIPGLAGLRRLPLIVTDMDDLGLGPADPAPAPAFAEGERHDVAEALGWLYVAEGSNLGAAILLKQAAALGLSERFGARHLAPSPAGRGLSWRVFASALDAAPLDAFGKARAASGAQAAFSRVHGLVAENFRQDPFTRA